MDPRKNPYSPGAGVKPPEFAGREAIMEDVEIALDRTLAHKFSQDFLLLGLRGVGKTVLLNALHDMARVKPFETVRIEAPEGGLLAQNIVPPLRRVIQRLSLKEEIGAKLTLSAIALRNFASIFKVRFEGFEFGIGERAVADTGDMERDLPELLTAVAEAAGSRQRALGVFIDEVQYLRKEEMAAIVRACHEASQRGLPLILVGAGLPQIAALAGEAKSYAERLFGYPEVGALSRDAAYRALAEPAEREGVQFCGEALNAIYQQTQGYPYFLQIWGKFVWDNAANSPLSIQDVENSYEDIIAHLDTNFFRSRFDRLSGLEQQYLRAMAELGSGPHRTGEIAKVLECDSQQVGTVRKRLIELGMVYSQRFGETAFTVPLFDQFLRRAIPTVEPYTPTRSRRRRGKSED